MSPGAISTYLWNTSRDGDLPFLPVLHCLLIFWGCTLCYHTDYIKLSQAILTFWSPVCLLLRTLILQDKRDAPKSSTDRISYCLLWWSLLRLNSWEGRFPRWVSSEVYDNLQKGSWRIFSPFVSHWCTLDQEGLNVKHIAQKSPCSSKVVSSGPWIASITRAAWVDFNSFGIVH